ncbi:uncharacterized protein cyr [Diabrotica undecimpunctata]|uniref:uncharacterized protein cyr n=1 Tax=Diabrotica undecimpunctata TaxID=50387 RepID=UPI003B63503E
MAMTNTRLSSWMYHLLTILAVPVELAFPPSLRYPLPLNINQVIQVNFTCDSENFNITFSMKSPFKGLLFARDFAQECKSIGNLSNKVQISLPTSGCGVRLNSAYSENGAVQMFYTVHLIVQQDRYLRQISDKERIVSCNLEDDDLLIRSKALTKTVKNDFKKDKLHLRVGRMKKEGWSKELDGQQLDEEIDEALSAARAWMEIVPENNDEKTSGTLQVGETASLSIKATLPAGIGWRVVDCLAHDGLGDSSQKLLNENGCPIDEFLMPSLQYGPIRPIALMQNQQAVTRFPAFKFPDRDTLHVSCGLQLCKGLCPRVNCNNDKLSDENNRSGRGFSDLLDGEILDRLEVFNSVEVLAPEIDDLRAKDSFESSGPVSYSFMNIPGDRTFCVSHDKMATAFCILGFIFFLAIIITACSMIKSKRDGKGIVFYSRSLFSGSSTSGSLFGSKIFLRDSPSLRNSPYPHSRGMQYGRIL